jgi:hypothetical protein
MMYGSQPQDEYYQGTDEHNAPTEPLSLIHPSSNSAGKMSGHGHNGALPSLPAPAPIEHPFPYLDTSPAGPHYRSPATPVYPVLPPIHAAGKRKKGSLPPGGTSSNYPSPVQKAAPRRRHSVIPSLVGIFFVAVQFLLLLRFLLKLINIPGNETWVPIVYTISSIFVLPFSLIFQHITLPIPISLEFYTLIAILVYGLLSRIVVRVLKALL